MFYSGSISVYSEQINNVLPNLCSLCQLLRRLGFTCRDDVLSLLEFLLNLFVVVIFLVFISMVLRRSEMLACLTPNKLFWREI